MKKSKYQNIFRLGLALVLVLLIAQGSVPGVFSTLAAPTDEINLKAVQDGYTDINAATTNFDEGLLTAANSPGPPEETDVTTKQIFLEFDLSAVDFEIRSATLSLSTLTCGGLIPVDVVDLAVYGVDNTSSWDQTTLTWANQPAISTEMLITLDEGGTIFGSAQTYTWTDDNQGDLANWLESQRGTNDSSATLVVQIENSANPGMADVFFEDSEGTGAAYGCADALEQPSLQVSDTIAGFELYIPFVER